MREKIAAVNPDTIKQFAVDNAVLETKREARWCLGKLVLLDAYTKKKKSSSARIRRRIKC